MNFRKILLTSVLSFSALSQPLLAASPHRLTLDDIARFNSVGNLACSADGDWIAYEVTTIDPEADKHRTAIWTVNWAGSANFPLTAEAESSNSPAFSADGRYLSFLSERGDSGHAQLYLLDRRGGEPVALTHVTGEILDYQWSPDSKKIVIAMTPPEPVTAGDKKAGKDSERPKPVVIDDYHFKQDRIGYLTPSQRSQLFMFDVAAKSLVPLADEAGYDLTNPVWSPDGAMIAFIADHSGDRDLPGIHQLRVIEPREGAKARQLTQFDAPTQQTLLWSSDGKKILHAVGFEPKYGAYSQDQLVATDSVSGVSQILKNPLDRSLSAPIRLPDGRSVAALLVDDRREYEVSVSLADGSVKKLQETDANVLEHCSGAGHVAVIASSDHALPELFAAGSGKLRQLTFHNKELLEQISLGNVEDIAMKSADGADIHGMMIKPPDYRPGQLYPTLLWIHGGPNGQDQHDLRQDGNEMLRQWLAANGYVVLGVNYRGSSGRGAEFARSIAADWGNREVADLTAALNEVIARKIADPERLGIGGWSYGGILTDYSIASDARFKAAVSGAGAGNWFSFYGYDQYVLQYSEELGPPWRNPDLWMKLSYPFFHADRIKTPTLFMGGTKDANVPLIGGEQMFEALKSLNVPTELVAYPNEYHGLKRPSFLRDRMERLVGWYDRYLK